MALQKSNNGQVPRINDVLDRIDREVLNVIRKVEPHYTNMQRKPKDRRLSNDSVITVVANEERNKLRMNKYAYSIFIEHTNARKVAESMNFVDMNAEIKILCKRFMRDPLLRWQEPTCNIKFNDKYHEYVFYLALNYPFENAEQHNNYKQELEKNNVTECWVDLSRRNLLYDHISAIIGSIKKRFVGREWAGKLYKLDDYLNQKLEMYNQKHRRLTFEDFANHSNIKTLLPSFTMEDLERRYRGLTSMNCSFRLKNFVFEDDHFNKIYKCGKYVVKKRKRMQKTLEVISEYKERRSIIVIDKLRKESYSSDAEVIPMLESHTTPIQNRSPQISDPFAPSRSPLTPELNAEIASMPQPSTIAAKISTLSSPSQTTSQAEFNADIVPSAIEKILTSSSSSTSTSKPECSAEKTPPAQQAVPDDVIIISDTESPPSSPKPVLKKSRKNLYSYDFLVQNSNLKEHLTKFLKKNYKDYERKLKKIDHFMVRYYDRHIAEKDTLPPGIKLNKNVSETFKYPATQNPNVKAQDNLISKAVSSRSHPKRLVYDNDSQEDAPITHSYDSYVTNRRKQVMMTSVGVPSTELSIEAIPKPTEIPCAPPMKMMDTPRQPSINSDDYMMIPNRFNYENHTANSLEEETQNFDPPFVSTQVDHIFPGACFASFGSPATVFDSDDRNTTVLPLENINCERDKSIFVAHLPVADPLAIRPAPIKIEYDGECSNYDNEVELISQTENSIIEINDSPTIEDALALMDNGKDQHSTEKALDSYLLNKVNILFSDKNYISAPNANQQNGKNKKD